MSANTFFVISSTCKIWAIHHLWVPGKVVLSRNITFSSPFAWFGAWKSSVLQNDKQNKSGLLNYKSVLELQWQLTENIIFVRWQLRYYQNRREYTSVDILIFRCDAMVEYASLLLSCSNSQILTATKCPTCHYAFVNCYCSAGILSAEKRLLFVSGGNLFSFFGVHAPVLVLQSPISSMCFILHPHNMFVWMYIEPIPWWKWLLLQSLCCSEMWC